MPLETRYAKSGDVNIAYQVVGNGPLDLVFVMGWISHLDGFWQEPRFARFLRRLASFARVILFDKRGTGLSDPVPLAELPTLEQRMDDVRAVMDAVGSERAALLGISEGGPMCALFAATYPERTAALVMLGCYARRLWAPDYPWGTPRDDYERWLEHIERSWRGPVGLNVRAPSLADDPDFTAWWARYLRMSVSPGAAAALTRMNGLIDVRHVLPAIHVPTLIVHRTGDLTVSAEQGRYMARQIPGARYVELPGDDHLPFVGDQDEILAEVEHFLTGSRPEPELDRVLATVTAIEIDAAAETAVRLGDRRWTEVRSGYDALVRDELGRFRGREAGRTLDGCLAMFDGPARAVRCADAVVTGARRLGLRARAGLHTGEVSVVGDDVAGVALHLAARVAAQAGPGDVVVSNTVKDLVAGSELAFQPVGDRVFPGLPGEWRLYRLAIGAAAERPAAAMSGLRSESAASRAGGTLSPREREVAALVALGLSNRQIADELVISVATVERHVTNILAKLGHQSRAQVAAGAVGQGLLRTAPA